jgi:ATP-dependent protease ClpP protease subunit
MTPEEIARLQAGELAELAARGGHDWFRVEAKKDSDEVEAWIYDEIGYWGTTADDFAKALPSSAKKITVRLNSPGGSVFQGLAIATTLRRHSATVHISVDGIAASIASVIAMAGDTVEMGRGTQMMIHDPSGLVLGNSRQMRSTADLLDKLARDSIADAYRSKAGGSLDQWLASMEAETWYSAEEAVEAGLADTVLGADDAPENSVKVFDLRAYGFRFTDRSEAPDPGALARKIRSDAARARVLSALKG